MTQLLPLNPTEAIFAPFHDPYLRNDMDFTFHPEAGVGSSWEGQWDSLMVKWSSCPVSNCGASVVVPLEFSLIPYDEFVLCLSASPEVEMEFSTKTCDTDWIMLGQRRQGEVGRMEIVLPIPFSSTNAFRVRLFALHENPVNVKLIWFAVRHGKLHEAVKSQRVTWHPEWRGLIHHEANWQSLGAFKHHLLGKDVTIEACRQKLSNPLWRDHFHRLERDANRAMAKAPEDFLAVSDYSPFTDYRYTRADERSEITLYYDSLRLALVGLINEDTIMIRHAARYFMVMLHLKSWSVSAELRMQGSTWDQRCFVEEMMSTACAMLLDWLDGVITDRARELAHTKLWDLGLSVIERDMAKFEYVHKINQGPWFCRGRILGSLVLENAWPYFNAEYADRAVRHLVDGMNAYIQPDGGMDEGPMYLLLTLETTLPPLIAYAQRRGLPPHDLLPKNLPLVENYLKALALSEPGAHVPNGDCASQYPFTDTYPILAMLYPHSDYPRVAAAGLLTDKPYTYQQHYVGTGIFSMLLGPESLREPQSFTTTFCELPSTGIASSFRKKDDKSLGIVFFGSKALASHAHFDRGSFSLEVDGEALFVDRGTVRYDDQRSWLLKRSDCHNLLVPSFDGITTEEQNPATVPVTPISRGDSTRFSSSLALDEVWKEAMTSYQREITSEDLEALTIKDWGQLTQTGQPVFLLHSRTPFVEAKSGIWHCGAVEIKAPWVERADTVEYLVDSEFRPVYRLRLWGPLTQIFSLETTITRS